MNTTYSNYTTTSPTTTTGPVSGDCNGIMGPDGFFRTVDVCHKVNDEDEYFNHSYAYSCEAGMKLYFVGEHCEGMKRYPFPVPPFGMLATLQGHSISNT